RKGNLSSKCIIQVRSAPALWLQEQFAAFAANFVRWADRWLTVNAANGRMVGPRRSRPASKLRFRSQPTHRLSSIGSLMVVC
ncbi:hypothetical protein, partial [Candidatus Amarolinea dominans]|uniref:hypothetical protein n=1 Tax=Candidatus Amarolinea dominans TaxID=3140696 RepID=UPI0031CCB1B4